MHNPITANAAPLVAELPSTMDTGIVCATCMDTLTPRGDCLNIGACRTADSGASRMSRGETVKSRMQPSAWTISGGVD